MDLTEDRMHYSKSMVALTVGCACFIIPFNAIAFDIGGSNGINVNGDNGLNVSVGGPSGINANVGGSAGLANASVGGAGGVNANGGGTSTGGLGVNASVGGSNGINSNTSIGGTTSSGGLDIGTTASIGGSGGVGADVDATTGGSSLATANANVGAGGNTLLDLMLGVPSVNNIDDGTSSGGSGEIGGTFGSGDSNVGTGRSRSLSMINDMSAGDRAKAKTRCKDVLRSGGYDASLVSLCKMVVAMR
jgi:hypothetical protein